jgi:PAS domain S-box-containing protein
MATATKRKSSRERLTVEKYLNLIEHAADGIAIIQDGVFKLVNTALARISGYDKEELLGMPFTKLLTPESQKLTVARYQARLTGKKVPPIYEVKAVTKKGEIRDIEINAALTEYEGRVADEVIIRDITERKQAEEALKESQKFSSSLLESSPNPISVVDPDTSVRYVNPAFEKLTGFTLAEIAGRKAPYPWWPEGKRKEITAAFKDAIAHGGRRTERNFQKKNGEHFWVAVSSAPVVHKGKPIHFILNWHDITERKQAEEALRQSEENLKTYLESAPDGVYINDLKGTFLYGNKKAEEIIGYKKEELIGKSFLKLNLLPAKYLAKAGKLLALNALGKPTRPEELELIRKDSTRVWVEISTTPIKQKGKTVVLGFVRDITERKQAEEALQTERNKLQSLIDAMEDDLTIQDKDLNIIYQNEPSRISSGGDYVGEKCYRVYEGREKMCDGCPVEKAFKDGKSHTAERMRVTPSGEVIFFENTANPIRDARGEIVACLEIGRSITERKKREQLQNSENYVLTLLGQGAELSQLLDAIVRLGEYHDPSIKGSVLLSGPSKEQLFLASALSLPDDYKKLFENGLPIGPKAGSCGSAAYLKERVIVTDIAKSPLFKPFDEVVKRAVNNGLLAVWSQPIIASSGEMLGTIANYSNKVGEPSADNLRVLEWSARIAALAIERKRAEEQLQEKNEQLDAQNEELRAINEELLATEEQLQQSQEKLERMFESVTEGIIVANLDGAILKVNEKTAQMLGFASDDGLLGKNAIELVVSRDRERIADNVRKALKEGLIRTQEYTMLRADGSEFPGELSTSALKDASGKVIGHITIVRDITERKQAEEKEERLQQELDLTSRLASIGQMASGVAHEINNPLTGVIGFSHLLMSRDIPDDMKQDLHVINSEAQRVAKIVENLLTFARQRKPGRECVVINNIIARVLELRSYEMKVNNIEVQTQLAPDLPYTMADAGQLQQVFLNIILNAEHFMTKAHNRGKLLVKTERIHGNIRASFTDDGPGISKENLDKVFNPFFTTKEVGSGTGLGLSICHGIITQHKGRIYAQSKLGQGATFVVELPIVDEPTWAGQAKVTKEEPQKPRGAKILVVDDEPAILTFLRRLLTEWGHSVETINNADAALERLKTERYSLILLDIKLPGMSGIELYHHIEEIAPALTRRIMFITGDVMEIATRDFLDKTKAPHITKPLNIEMLKKTINHTLNQTHVAATTPG